MTSGRVVVERDVIRFFHPVHGKSRTGVVIQVQSDRLIVIYGRGTELDKEHVTVPHPSAAATALDLYKPTHFYATSLARVLATSVERVGHCPPRIFEQLRPLALKGVRYMTTIEPTPTK